MFEASRLITLCPRASQKLVKALASALEAKVAKYKVTTLLRRSHFLGQVAYESNYFSTLEENLNYSADRIPQVWPRLTSRANELAHNPQKLANAAYANKLGNGDEASGDGWRWRGRGLIMTTGHREYQVLSNIADDSSILTDPDKAAQPDTAVEMALAYWSMNGCNELADLDDVSAITREINGNAMLGLEARRTLTNRAKTIFVDEAPLIA